MGRGGETPKCEKAPPSGLAGELHAEIGGGGLMPWYALGVDPWYAKLVMIVGSVGLVGIPYWVHRKRGGTRVVSSHRGALEKVLLAMTTLAFVLVLVWLATPVLAAADYQLRPICFIAGSVCMAGGLWVLYRAHADLGANWSITLELREGHELVERGIYRRVRHPMYLALLLYGLGQALVLPNWVAGPAYLVAVGALVALRIGPEERMMVEKFGGEYEAYVLRSKRLLPGVW